LSRDQFMWGLSNGVIVLAVSGGFWIGLAAWTLGTSALLIATGPILLLAGFLIWRGVQLRRQAAGFSRASLRRAEKGSATRRINIGFQAVTATQTLGIVLVGVICSTIHRPDLIWPLIGLVVSLHFLPLGRLFSVRPYYFLGVLGTAIALVSLVGFSGSTRSVVTGLGLGLLTDICVVYLVANASALADHALRNQPLSASVGPRP
jgi:uncharacterized membrane protein